MLPERLPKIRQNPKKRGVQNARHFFCYSVESLKDGFFIPAGVSNFINH
jgi:hypothetical protein